MQPEIILQGITLDQLTDRFKCIVQNEVDRAISNLTTSTTEPTPEYLTRKETAKIYGVTLVTLNEWTKAGKVPAKRIGNRVRYLKTDVYAALQDVETLKYRRG